MTKYHFPELPAELVLYKGRRFVVFRCLRNSEMYDFEGADIFVWDGLYDAALSYARLKQHKVVDGYLAFCPVGWQLDDADSIKDFVEVSKKAQLKFFKETGT